MLKEFREFAMRGNVVDLAVGVIIGAAFGAVVTSLVADIMMPPIGRLIGGLDVKDYFIMLETLDGGTTYKSLDEVKKAGVPVIAYGNFINTVVNFLIVAFAIFLLVKQVNRFRAPAPPPPPPATKECRFCGMDIPIKAIRCPQCTSELKTA
jgi:large conductance mechanosensitive channel